MNYMQHSLICLPEPQAGKVTELIKRGEKATLFSEVEVLELGQGGQALIWIYQPGGGGSRIGSCALSPGQWAEAMLCLGRGMRPVFAMTWHVLGRSSDGRFSLGASDPALEARAAEPLQAIEELIG